MANPKVLVYEEKKSLEQIPEIFKKCAGIYFTPHIVDIFLNLRKELEEQYG